MIENRETKGEELSTPGTTENEVLTKVTTLAQEDEKNGTKTVLPSAEELVQRASISFFQKRKMFGEVLNKLSKRGVSRVLAAGLDLPQSDLPVLLRSEEEKLGYALLQRIQQDRFLIIQNEINKQMIELKAKKEQEIKQQEGVNNV